MQKTEKQNAERQKNRMQKTEKQNAEKRKQKTEN